MLRKIFLLLILSGSLSAAYSGPTEDRLKAIDAKDYPGANVVVVFDSTFSNVQESGLTYVNMHRLYKVMTPAGALQLSVIKIDYDPLSAYVDIKKVVVYRGRGGDGAGMGAGKRGSRGAGKHGGRGAWRHGGYCSCPGLSGAGTDDLLGCQGKDDRSGKAGTGRCR